MSIRGLLVAKSKLIQYFKYNGRDIASLEPDVDNRIIDLLTLIRTQYGDGMTVDFASIARYFTLDVLSTVAFGRPFGFMAANDDLWDYNKTTSGFMLVLNLVANHASVRWLFYSHAAQALGGPKITDKSGVGPMLRFAREAVAERFGPKSVVKQDMLGHFVSRGLSQVQCEAEANLQIVAGSDSTTTVLRSILFLLVGTPLAYLKIRAEIDEAVASGTISSDPIKYSESLKLPYLQACVWEGLRLFPPLFGLKAKVAPVGGDTIKGVYYPEGTEMSICDDALCRNPEIFGSDAHLYRPERWLDATAGAKTQYRHTVDSVFGSGRFQCLGRHIAMMELHKATVEVCCVASRASPMRCYV